jgi:hypothetical protein
MLAIMFDLCFENMKVIWIIWENSVANEIVADMMQRLCIHFYHMFILSKPYKSANWSNTNWRQWFFLWVIISSDDVIKSTLKNELQWFRQLCVW